MLAKIASDVNKPNGQCVVPSDRKAILSFLDELPVRKIPGIGAVTQGSLKEVDIELCKDVRDERKMFMLFQLFSHQMALRLIKQCLGDDSWFATSRMV